MPFLAIKMVVEMPEGTTFEQRQALDDRIQNAAAGHDCSTDKEAECPLRFFASSSGTHEQVDRWLG